MLRALFGAPKRNGTGRCWTKLLPCFKHHGLRPADPDGPDALWNASLVDPRRGAGAGREDNGAIKPNFVQQVQEASERGVRRPVLSTKLSVVDRSVNCHLDLIRSVNASRPTRRVVESRGLHPYF